MNLRGTGLLAKGEPEVFTGGELKYIGMPVGGLFAGTVYLGGDGQLWNWDIFNQERLGCVEREPVLFMGDTLNAMGGANYVDPVQQQSPFKQSWRLEAEDGRPVRFGDIRFRGEYPVGKVQFLAADRDVEMTLEAFSPFCPLDVETSSYPAVTLTFRVKNTGSQKAVYRLACQAENPVLIYSRAVRRDFDLTGERVPDGALFGARSKTPADAGRPAVMFENWESGTYGQWTTEGTAFGAGPQRAASLPGYMGPVNAETTFVVNSHQTRNGEDVIQADDHQGTLTSPAFRIERKFINLRVGGGGHKGGTCVNLVVDGRVAASVSGRNSNVMRWEALDVSAFEGLEAVLQVADKVSGSWGQISLGEVEFADSPRSGTSLEASQDFGSFCIAFLGGADEAEATPEAAKASKRLALEPGQESEITLVMAWHFPNCPANVPGKRHWYASRWKDAQDAASDLLKNWVKLQSTTRAWNRTWYDSTLPVWVLDRTFVNTSILATTTCLRLDEGRFYFWEGVGCCPGTCTHVWGYAQAVGRVFPEVEGYLREEIDFGMAYQEATGAIDYRAEYQRAVAVDGQASCILRARREHLMSKDGAFLDRIWPRVKGAMLHLIDMEGGREGLLDGDQYNTLDTSWFGRIAWISSLYLAALRASEAMAAEQGDAAFAAECRAIAEKGTRRLVEELFDGEYFINRVDPDHPEANNTNLGCHIDQVYGQMWAHQAGLPRVVPAKECKAALRALMKHSYFEDVWEYRRRNRAIPGGRWYAAPPRSGPRHVQLPQRRRRRSSRKERRRLGRRLLQRVHERI